jgi:hypothetical protein
MDSHIFVVTSIINFDVGECISSCLLHCGRFCVPLVVPLSWLYVYSVA